MIRDILRAVLTIAVMAVAGGLLIEVRYSLAAIDLAHRHSLAGTAPQWQPVAPAPEPGRLRRFGRATLDLADAALGVVR